MYELESVQDNVFGQLEDVQVSNKEPKLERDSQREKILWRYETI